MRAECIYSVIGSPSKVVARRELEVGGRGVWRGSVSCGAAALSSGDVAELKLVGLGFRQTIKPQGRR